MPAMTRLRSRAGRGSGAGEAYDPDAQAYFAAAGVTSEPYLSAINQFIVDLKAASLWTKFDRLWVLANEDAAAAVKCVKSLQDATPVNNPTFTAGRGYAGNGSSSYLNTNYAIGTHTVQFAQDSCSLFVYNRSNDANGRDIGGDGIGGVVEYALWSKSNLDGVNALAGISSAAGSHLTVSNPNAIGFHLISRTGPSTQGLYKNGALIGSNASTSLTLNAVTLYIGANNFRDIGPNQFSSHQLALAGVAAGFSAVEIAAFQICVDAIKTAIGF